VAICHLRAKGNCGEINVALTNSLAGLGYS
jgi:hypothetical protein